MASETDGVIIGASRVEYADGSEDAVLAVIESIVDRSTGSPEWAEHIVDWPTRYHFSPLRANLLRPLTIEPGTRVLEVGCGTGPLTRHLGERGAHVLAVDGSLDRARAAARRCADLPDVRVMCGTIDDVDERDFDVVLVIGVLEYAGAPPQATHPEDWLQRCVDHLSPDGALVLAIENQLGLKYLVGYDEDHHAVPWVGLTDYDRTEGARTWSRAELCRIIARCGLDHQHLLFPYPDYKLPTVVVDQSAHERPDAPEVLDALLRRPVSDDAGRPHLVVDARRAHRVMLDAGLGQDVANSLMVVAGRHARGVEAVVPDRGLAWFSNEGRAPQWRRHRVLVADGADLAVVELGSSDTVERTWLRQTREATRPFVPGSALDQTLVAAFQRGDVDGAGRILQDWAGALGGDPTASGPAGGAHPFAPVGEERSLPADHLDVALSNFVVGPGGLSFVDAEWQASAPVGRDLVCYRAMWWTTHDLFRELVALPWAPDRPLRELVAEMAALAGLELAPGVHERFLVAEAELQALVNDQEPSEVRRALEEMGGITVGDITPRSLAIADLEQLVGTLRTQVSEVHAAAAVRDQQLAALIERQQATDRELAEVREVLGNTEREVEALKGTKVFRWSSAPRRWYASLRGRV